MGELRQRTSYPLNYDRKTQRMTLKLFIHLYLKNASMKIEVDIPDTLYAALARLGDSCGCHNVHDMVVASIERFVSPGSGYDGSKHESDADKDAETLYISAPILDLVDGLLEGTVSMGKALAHGTFGLGTLRMLDGEVVVLDGVAYQQTADGECRVVPVDATSPFMMVCNFTQTSCSGQIGHASFEELQSSLSQMLSSKNLFTAIKIKGSFKYIKVRAVRKQEHNRPLVEVTREQAIIEFHGDEQPQEGYLVGFFSPKFLGHQLSVPGFHLHFLTSDFRKGGHVLDLVVDFAEVYCQTLHSMIQEFPSTDEFAMQDFDGNDVDREVQLKEAEG